MTEKTYKRSSGIVGVSLLAAGASLGLTVYGVYDARKSFRQEAVTIESKVVGERYVPAFGGLFFGTVPSQYFFSVDDPIKGRISVEVRGEKESIDARLDIGTKIKIRAVEKRPLEYLTYSKEIEVVK